MPPHLRRLLLPVLVALCVIHPRAADQRWSAAKQAGSLLFSNPHGQPVVAYQFEADPASKLPIRTAGYFRDLTTPNGVPVIEVAPPDHKHHRGIFFAWVEMHGLKAADFWGWGQYAPITNREIVNLDVKLGKTTASSVSFTAKNSWNAEGEVLVTESVSSTVSEKMGVRLIDVAYELVPKADIKAARWAFSGFCVRVKKAASIEVHDPNGLVNLPPPSHLKPESDWPDRAWYDFSVTQTNGTKTGVAIINHPKNSATLWHNIPGLGMMNPCVVAPADLLLKKGQKLVLNYRVVAHDGEVPRETLNTLAKEFGAH